MTEAIYLEVSEMAEAANKAGRRVSVSGMLKHLGVSRSGYHAWLKRVPSNTERRREAVKAKIKDIYDEAYIMNKGKIIKHVLRDELEDESLKQYFFELTDGE